MAYFITGGTGFIGRHLVPLLAARGEPIYLLVRPGSRQRLELLFRNGPAESNVVPVVGDLGSPMLGVDPQLLRGRVRHFIHLAALYDLTAGSTELERANVTGTSHALELARALQADCFHHVSSIAVAGRYPGTFTEEMFEEASGLDHPYFRTKHVAEALVRASSLPWRVYRPGMVVGHSQTGEMARIDGPYYLFKSLQKLRERVPSWVPLPRFDGGHVNLVPVDFVAAALDYLVNRPGLDHRCFHLADPTDRRVGEVLNVFAEAAHAPVMSLRMDAASIQSLGGLAARVVELGNPLRRVAEDLLQDLGVPQAAIELLDHPTRVASVATAELLSEAAIRVPRLEDYAWRLWDYWERILDSRQSQAERLACAVRGKSVLITGGSSGIGRATANLLAHAGARVLIVGRDSRKLQDVQREICSSGALAQAFSCDLTDETCVQGVISRILREQGAVDILINNAGHSIRRAIEHTYDRFHDYERLMKVNYFGAVRVTLGLLPSMVERGSGHVIAVSSIGVLGNAPRFAAYNASKAALEAFCRCAAAEYKERGIRFTVINMPLVRTPMVEPTKIFEQFPLISAEKAAGIVGQAVTRRPERLSTSLGTLARIVEILAPGVNTTLMSEAFRMFPESVAAGGAGGSDALPPSAVPGLASLLQGVGS